ncbi:DUF3168 domain-containing protein [Afipia sp. TerB]
MSDGSFELQAAVFTALNSLSPALASGGVHSPAGANTPLPYVEIGDADTIPADVQCRAGLDETVTIHIWTAKGSFAPAKQIISRIRDALHAQNLTVSGRSSAFAIVSSTRIFTDDDGESIHGVVTLSVNHFGPKES